MSWEMQGKLYNLHIRMKHLLDLGLSFVSCISLKKKKNNPQITINKDEDRV